MMSAFKKAAYGALACSAVMASEANAANVAPAIEIKFFSPSLRDYNGGHDNLGLDVVAFKVGSLAECVADVNQTRDSVLVADCISGSTIQTWFNGDGVGLTKGQGLQNFGANRMNASQSIGSFIGIMNSAGGTNTRGTMGFSTMASCINSIKQYALNATQNYPNTIHGACVTNDPIANPYGYTAYLVIPTGSVSQAIELNGNLTVAPTVPLFAPVKAAAPTSSPTP